MPAQSLLECTTEFEDGTPLLVCPSDLTRGQQNQLLGVALPLIEQNGLVIDMSRVQSIDAGGIGLLVFLRQCADRAGTSLGLINPSNRVREMLALVHLDQIFLAN
jgi:anti-anti-sigma factor